LGFSVQPMLKAIIFDWSGTLVDDMPPVIEATNSILARCGRPLMDRETFRREFCLPFDNFYKKHAPEIGPAKLEACFRKTFAESSAPVTLLPHVEEFLKFSRSKGHQHIVLSSALQAAVEAQATAFGLTGYFDAIYAGIMDKRLFIAELLAKHNLKPEEALYLGDMVHDAETAQHAGIKFVGLLTGYDHEDTLRQAGPDMLVADLKALQDGWEG
jgi:phosphoglycolate phosphatase